jgi:hypothetical protein
LNTSNGRHSSTSIGSTTVEFTKRSTGSHRRSSKLTTMHSASQKVCPLWK